MSILNPKDNDYVDRGLLLMIPLAVVAPIVFSILFAFLGFTLFGGGGTFAGIIIGAIFGGIFPAMVYHRYLNWAEGKMKAKRK